MQLLFRERKNESPYVPRYFSEVSQSSCLGWTEGLAGNSKPTYEVCDSKSEKFCFKGTLYVIPRSPGLWDWPTWLNKPCYSFFYYLPYEIQKSGSRKRYKSVILLGTINLCTTQFIWFIWYSNCRMCSWSDLELNFTLTVFHFLILG